MRAALVLVAALTLAAGAVAIAAPTKQPANGGPPKIVQFFKHGHPKRLNGYTIPLGSVPQGKTWTIKHVELVVEKHTGVVPYGGEFTISLFLNGTPIKDSSLETGNRVAFQGQGAVDITLPPRAKLSVFVWLGTSIALDYNLGYYYFGASVVIEERRVS
jgi:hypothetical protein